ncbi:MAG: hypothetical protein IJZ70_05765 [Bacteroidales bacterium]|nr:hypothetical protein [Bacteroidales bacterium]
MRKTAMIILLTITAAICHAQNAYDALLFSENNYEGTARTMAMGNAFTALGGDLGAVGINPAGSAVASYSQITLTPALTFAASTTKGISPYEDGYLPYFEKKMRSSMADFSMPNVGISINYDTHRTSGLKNITFGFTVNKTASWDEDVYANGTNSTTSFMGALAYEASQTGITGTELGSDGIYWIYPHWSHIVGYQSGMISPYDYDDQFVGASEVIYDNGIIALGGPIEQTYGRRKAGGKLDYLFNIGANISDFIYIGANLGVTSIDYSSQWYFKEVASDPSDFEIEYADGSKTYFHDMKYETSYSVMGTGYYGKFGVIITPGGGIRIGAAIQTPTITNISEEWLEAGTTTFSDTYYQAESPVDQISYKVISPFRANFGAAYTFGQAGLISVDYEVCDYSQMQFKANYSEDSYFYDEANANIKEWFGKSHMLRAGLEVKPLSSLSVRAGYGFTTSPDIFYDEFGKRLPASMTHNVSLGLGYSSKGSFFADFAIRRTIMPNEAFMPYPDYLKDENGNILENGYAPEILVRKSLWKALLTFGWRF